MLSISRCGHLARLALVLAVFVLVLVAGSVVQAYSTRLEGSTANIRNDSVPNTNHAAIIQGGLTDSASVQSNPPSVVNDLPKNQFVSFLPGRGDSFSRSGESRANDNLGFFSAGCGTIDRICANLTYHNGRVMHNPADFLIFWLPPGYHFDNSTIDFGATNPSDSRYEQLIIQYFSDICHPNAFYGILQQYPDDSSIQSCSLGGHWIDTSKFPNGRGSQTNPLTFADIQNEVSAALSSNTGWSSNSGNNEFFVFTGYEVCSQFTGCTGNNVCAYHSYFTSSTGVQMVYAYMPDPGSLSTCQLTLSPNQDAFADSVINFASHEQFEAFTDPTGAGWFYQDPGHEIGDECDWIFDSSGTNLYIGADKYLIQDEWSNRAHGCTSQGFGCGATGLTTDRLGCDGLGPRTIGLTWGQSGYSTNFSIYEVQESTAGYYGPWTTIDTIDSISTTTDYIGNLSPDTNYWWAVTEVSTLNQTARTNVLQITQPSVATLTYTEGPDTTYRFNWDNGATYSGSVAFDSYRLEESTSGGSYFLAQTIRLATSMTFSIDLSSASSYSFYLNTTDRCGVCFSSLATSTLSNTVSFTTPHLLLVSVSAERSSADANQPVSFTCNASGGVSPYNYSWAFGDGATGAGRIVSHGYSLPGTVSVGCAVRDGVQTNVTGLPVSVNIFTDPFIVVGANSSSVDVGQVVEFTSQATGGSGSYSFNWLHLPSGCSSAASASVTCKPTTAGSYAVSLNVADSNAFSVSSLALPLTVYTDPSVRGLTVSPNNLDLGQSATIAVSAAGGNGVLSYSYSGLPSGCTTTNQPSFACTPSAAGNYSVSVGVTDLNGFTVVNGPVSITVNPPLTTTLQVTPSALDLGQSVTLAITASGGTGSFSYSYQTLPPGCSSSSTPSLTCYPSQIGRYAVQIVATDQVGGTAMSSVTLTVNADPTISSFMSSKEVLETGQRVTLTVSASPGTGVLTYSYSGLPSSCISTNTSNLSCNPSASGNYTVVVTIHDQAGLKATSSARFTVNLGPKITTFTTSLSSLDVGQNILLAVSAGGGTGQLTYTYSGLPQGCTSSNAPTLPCNLSTSGSYTVTVTVTDSIGGIAYSSVSIKVAPDPSIASFTASHSTVNIGQDLTLTVSASGGTEPLSYSYSGLPPGCLSTDSASLSCTPSTTGSYEVQVNVTDQVGKTSTSSISINVNPQSLFGLPIWEGYSIISGIVVAALALSIGVLRSRKTRAQSQRQP